MALHNSLESLLKDSLPEFLEAAEFCLKYHKPNDGTLGCPAAALLFSIADSIGSYHRGLSGFSVLVDGKRVSITKNNFQHYYIFNSNYYDLNLSKTTISTLYNKFRCPLLHNSALMLDGHCLFEDEDLDEPFPTDQELVHVNLSAFLRVSQKAVRTFMKQIDKVVPGSEQEQHLLLKATNQISKGHQVNLTDVTPLTAVTKNYCNWTDR